MLCSAFIACALMLSLATSGRKIYVSSRGEIAKQFEIEWGQLQLEQSTWAMHARIEKIAARNLGMRVPAASRVQVVPPASPEEAR